MVADVPATVCQDLDRSDFQRIPKTAHEFFIPFRPAAQYILVDEYLAAREVNFPDTEAGGGVEVWLQFRAGNLLQAVVGRRRGGVTMFAPEVANRALHHPQ